MGAKLPAGLALAALLVLATLVILSWNYVIWGYDFHLFQPAATVLRMGQNPYVYDFHDPVYSFHNPVFAAASLYLCHCCLNDSR